MLRHIMTSESSGVIKQEIRNAVKCWRRLCVMVSSVSEYLIANLSKHDVDESENVI